MWCGSIATPPFCTTIGPVSTPASGWNTVTPVSASPEQDLPGQRVAAAILRQQRGMEAERSMARRVHDLRGQDHRHEGEHVEVGAERLVLGHALGNGCPLPAQRVVSKQAQPALLGLFRERVGPRAGGRRVDADDLVAGVEQPHQHVAPERGLAEVGDAQPHRYLAPVRSPTVPCGSAGVP